MNVTYRIIVLAAVMIVATAGCQKAPQGDASKAKTGQESKKSAVGGTAKAGKSDGQGAKTGKSAAKHEGGSGTASSGSGTSSGSKDRLYLTEADDSRNIDMRDGEIIVVKLKANRASGFAWVMVDSTGDVLVRAGNPSYVANASTNGKVGSGGVETWRFRAVRPGEQTMRLEYRRPWERNVPERKFRFSVTVK